MKPNGCSEEPRGDRAGSGDSIIQPSLERERAQLAVQGALTLPLPLWESATVNTGLCALLHVFCLLNSIQVVMDVFGSS